MGKYWTSNFVGAACVHDHLLMTVRWLYVIDQLAAFSADSKSLSHCISPPNSGGGEYPLFFVFIYFVFLMYIFLLRHHYCTVLQR